MRSLKNISWVLIANFIVAGLKWLVIIVIARLLTPQDVGIYSLAFAVSAPLALFMDMKLRSLYVIDNENSFFEYLKTRRLTVFLSIGLLIFIDLFLYPFADYIIFLVGLIKILDLVSETYYALAHKAENLILISKIMTIKHIITYGSFFIVLFITKDLSLSLFMQIIVQVIFLIFVERKYLFRYILNKDKYDGQMLHILKSGIPLGIVLMLTSLQTNIPRYILEFVEDLKTLGYFAAISYIVVAGNLVMKSVSQTFLPSLSKDLHLKDYSSFKKKIFIQLNSIALILGVGLILFSLTFGELFLEILYGESYGDYTYLLVLMSIAVLFNFIGWNFDLSLMALNYIRIQPIISIVVVIVSLLTSIIMINIYGLVGAALTIIISNFIQMTLRIIASLFKMYKMKIIWN